MVGILFFDVQAMTLDREKQKSAFKRISGRLKEHELWLSQAKSRYSEEETADVENAIHSHHQLMELQVDDVYNKAKNNGDI